MAKIYDLSEYLGNEKSKIKIGEHEFAIDDGFNTLVKVDALMNKEGGTNTHNIQFIVNFMEVALGKEQADELIGLNLGMKAYTKIMESIQDAFMNDDGEGPQQVSPGTTSTTTGT